MSRRCVMPRNVPLCSIQTLMTDFVRVVVEPANMPSVLASLQSLLTSSAKATILPYLEVTHVCIRVRACVCAVFVCVCVYVYVCARVCLCGNGGGE